ncbi:MAG: hypothetical protein ACPGAP_08990, partial [Akkermansiaceae bacterium]
MANRRNSGPSRPRSSGRRRGLPGGLHQLARNQVNRRGGRRLNMTRQSAIAGSATAADYYEEEDFLSRSFLKRLFHWAIGIFLIPLCFITVITLIKESGEDRIL